MVNQCMITKTNHTEMDHTDNIIEWHFGVTSFPLYLGKCEICERGSEAFGVFLGSVCLWVPETAQA